MVALTSKLAFTEETLMAKELVLVNLQIWHEYNQRYRLQKFQNLHPLVLKSMWKRTEEQKNIKIFTIMESYYVRI